MALCDGLKVETIGFTTVHGCPGYFRGVDLSGVPITRLPEGNQEGLPAILDVVCAKDGVVVGGVEVNWFLALADHAAVLFTVPCNFLCSQIKRKQNWRNADLQPFVDRCGTLLRSEMPDPKDTMAVLSLVTALQDEYSDKRTSAQRRLFREPQAVKQLRLLLRSA